jgi:hypothetical protein
MSEVTGIWVKNAFHLPKMKNSPIKSNIGLSSDIFFSDIGFFGLLSLKNDSNLLLFT